MKRKILFAFSQGLARVNSVSLVIGLLLLNLITGSTIIWTPDAASQIVGPELSKTSTDSVLIFGQACYKDDRPVTTGSLIKFENDIVGERGTAVGDSGTYSIILPLLTDIEPLPNPSVIKSFHLYDPYPNPPEPGTNPCVEFRLHKQSQVKIAIYNIRGGLVKILDERVVAKGRYGIKWDDTDRFGKQVANGLYFVTITENDFHASKKIVKLGSFAPASNKIEKAGDNLSSGNGLAKGLDVLDSDTHYKVTIIGPDVITFIDSVIVNENQREHNFTDVDRMLKFVKGCIDSLYSISGDSTLVLPLSIDNDDDYRVFSPNPYAMVSGDTIIFSPPNADSTYYLEIIAEEDAAYRDTVKTIVEVSGVGELRGKIIDPLESMGVGGLTVKLIGDDFEEVITSSDSGNYAFSHLKPGQSYRLEISDGDGNVYFDRNVGFLNINSGDNVRNVELMKDLGIQNSSLDSIYSTFREMALRNLGKEGVVDTSKIIGALSTLNKNWGSEITFYIPDEYNATDDTLREVLELFNQEYGSNYFREVSNPGDADWVFDLSEVDWRKDRGLDNQILFDEDGTPLKATFNVSGLFKYKNDLQ